MKNRLLVISVTLMLAATLCAGANPRHATNSPSQAAMSEDSAPLTTCGSGDVCVGSNQGFVPGDGGPQPVCAPGKNCNNDQFQLRAGDGGPQPVCAPGKNCNNDQLKLQMFL